MRKYIFFSLIITLVFQFKVWSQQANFNTEFLDKSLTNAKDAYRQNIGNQLQIYNGIEYMDYDKGIAGHPFYLSDYYEYGELEYDGEIYDSVEMKYDIHKDLLVIKYYNQFGYRKDLIPDINKATGFHFLDHSFIVVHDTSDTQLLESGIYELLFKKEFYLLSKRSKELFEEVDGKYLRQRFVDKNRYYILKDEQLLTIKNKRSMLKAFPEQKKTLQKYIRNNRLDFGNDFEESIISAARYYSTLKE